MEGECIFRKGCDNYEGHYEEYSVYEYYDNKKREYVQVFYKDDREIMRNHQRYHMSSKQALALLSEYVDFCDDCDCDDCDDCDCDCDCDDYDDDDDCDCDDYDDDDDCDCDDYDDDDDCDCDCDYD